VGYYVSRSTNGGVTFSVPVEVAEGPHPGTGSNIPSLIVRPDGKIVVTWIDATFDVIVVTSNDGTTFSSPIIVSNGTTNSIDEATAVSPQGQIYLLWTEMATTANCSIYFSKSADAATFSTPRSVSDNSGSCNQEAAAAVDSSGNLDVTWVADGTSLFFSRTTDSGASFIAPVSIPTGANPNSDEVFAGPDGAIYVLWDAGGPKFSSSQDSGATFFKNPTAIGIAISGGPPSLVADACGNVTVVGDSGTIDTFYQRSADGGNTFASPIDISDTHFNYEQQLAIDNAGNVNFTWTLDGPQFIEYVRLPTTCSIH
jgi:hypothetical protein